MPTAYNKQGLFQGSRDISIIQPDNESKTLIHANIKKLAEIDQVICSGLKRTQETAILHNKLDFIVDQRINEFSFGRYEGLLKTELPEYDKKIWTESPMEAVFGESILAFRSRVDSFLKDIKNLNKDVLLFTHGVVGRYLIATEIYGDANLTNKMFFPHNQLASIVI